MDNHPGQISSRKLILDREEKDSLGGVLKVYLHFDGYYQTEMPDINASSYPWQQVLKERIDHALSEASDNWIMEYLDVVPV
jgi:hypothetical protein